MHPVFALLVSTHPHTNHHPPHHHTHLLSFLGVLKSVYYEVFQEFSRHSRASGPKNKIKKSSCKGDI